jgi:hypothetical protein
LRFLNNSGDCSEVEFILLTLFDLVKHSTQVYNRAIEVVSVTYQRITF